MTRHEILSAIALAAMPRLLTLEQTIEYVGVRANLDTLKEKFHLRPSIKNGEGRTAKEYYDRVAVDNAVDRMTEQAYMDAHRKGQ